MSDELSPRNTAKLTRRTLIKTAAATGAMTALLQDSVQEIAAALGNTAIMITHDVDEAVLLSDRIVMMTNGPAATIGEVLAVPLPRPRRRLELAAHPVYLDCRRRVLEFLYRRHRAFEAA